MGKTFRPLRIYFRSFQSNLLHESEPGDLEKSGENDR